MLITGTNKSTQHLAAGKIGKPYIATFCLDFTLKVIQEHQPHIFRAHKFEENTLISKANFHANTYKDKQKIVKREKVL